MAIFSPSNGSVGEGGSNITEKSHTLDFTVLGNDKIIQTHCYFDTQMIRQEARLFRKKIADEAETADQYKINITLKEAIPIE